MNERVTSRRGVVAGLMAAAAATLPPGRATSDTVALAPEEAKRGAQRLSLQPLRKWESLAYGIFLNSE